MAVRLLPFQNIIVLSSLLQLQKWVAFATFYICAPSSSRTCNAERCSVPHPQISEDRKYEWGNNLIVLKSFWSVSFRLRRIPREMMVEVIS